MASKSSRSRPKAGTSLPISEDNGVSDVALAAAPPESAAVSENPNAGHRERLRARFLAGGAEAMPDYELLELVLFAALPRRDTKPLAKALLKRFGSFAEVIAAPRDRLMEIPGVGDSVVSQLKIVEAAAARLAKTRVIGQARALLMGGAAGLLHGGDGAGDGGGIPRAVPGPQECPDRRRGAGARHGGPHPGLSARDRQAGAGAQRLRHHSGAQSSQRRSQPRPRPISP